MHQPAPGRQQQHRLGAAVAVLRQEARSTWRLQRTPGHLMHGQLSIGTRRQRHLHPGVPVRTAREAPKQYKEKKAIGLNCDML